MKFLIVDHSVNKHAWKGFWPLSAMKGIDIYKFLKFLGIFHKKKQIVSLPHFLGTLSWTSSVCQSNSLLVVNILPQWQNNSLGGLTGLFASWILLCSLKLECLLKPLPQILQDKGVSPVCTRTCSRSLIGVKNVFGQ